jgi:hypothetical protein
MKVYAVLTGDLVDSSRLEAERREAMMAWLKSLASEFAGIHPGAVVGQLDVFRGDGWQLCLEAPGLALEAAIFIRAGLKAHVSRENLDTRVGIGLGSVERLNTERISESNGAAFLASGHALDALEREEQRLRLRGEGANVSLLDVVSLPLLDLAVSQWTHPESVAVYGTLSGWTQEAIAAHPLAAKQNGEQPSRQSVGDALTRVCWKSHLMPALLEAASLLENPKNNNASSVACDG